MRTLEKIVCLPGPFLENVMKYVIVQKKMSMLL